ncbi:MAG: carboxypeptidase regulatory-like domain-containing protein [Planctomycetes bacterium]|nr:carboxypeptidase regulatory-like domain-containing protein [Planctomycetota bacterium]
MRPRDLILLCSTLALGALAGLAFLSQETLATVRPPNATGPGSLEHAAEAVSQPQQASVAEGSAVRDGSSPALAVEATVGRGDKRTDTATWTKGVIRGDIQVAVSALEHLKTLTILVEEQRSAIGPNGEVQRPVRIMVPAKQGLGTPTFEVTDIPFSEHPYVVSVYAEGLNGGRRTVTIDEDQKLVDDVVLTVSPGSPHTVFVRDQDGKPYLDVDVRLQPVGEPLGRPRQAGKTDGYGAAVFGNVLAGEYQLFISHSGQLLCEVQAIRVLDLIYPQPSTPKAQSTSVVVPRGVQVELSVHDAAGYGVAEASVKAVATDRVRHTEIPAATDPQGRLVFPHLQPGTWHVQVEKEGFQRADLQLNLSEGQEPQYRTVRLVRLRG